MATVHTPRTPQISSADRYVNPAFTTDSLEDEDSSSTLSPSPSPKQYTFTPRRVAKLPRAWERKPATPFAPRTDGQRIWKRVPLGEMQSNAHISQGPRTRGEEGMKVVKRLRADMNEHENATYLSTKWDDAQEIVKRKVSQPLHIAVGAAGNKETICDGIHSNASPEFKLERENDAGNLEDPVTAESSTSPTDDLESVGTMDQSVVHEKLLASEEPVDDSTTARDIPAQPEQQTEFADSTTLQSPEAEKGMEAEEDAQPSPAAGELVVENTEAICSVPETDPSLCDSAPSKSPSKRRRSSLAALFTGNGLVCPPQPAEDTTDSGPNSLPNQPAAAEHDDTAFLHEFLTRARAQKAAKASGSPEKPAARRSSPTKKVRQALSSVDANSPSPPPVMEPSLNPDELSEEHVEAQASSPCRRSIRTRLPRPPKAVTAAPSNIPVRRSNGTEFVFLQRTEAQEFALATRANTKRNKGDAMPPKIKLPIINVSGNPSPTKSPRKRKGRKEVSWSEKLAQYRESEIEELARVSKAAETTETSSMDSKPKARKMKRLGTVNGTPAPKRTTMEEERPESHIPTRKLRSRVKS